MPPDSGTPHRSDSTAGGRQPSRLKGRRHRTAADGYPPADRMRDDIINRAAHLSLRTYWTASRHPYWTPRWEAACRAYDDFQADLRLRYPGRNFAGRHGGRLSLADQMAIRRHQRLCAELRQKARVDTPPVWTVTSGDSKHVLLDCQPTLHTWLWLVSRAHAEWEARWPRLDTSGRLRRISAWARLAACRVRAHLDRSCDDFVYLVTSADGRPLTAASRLALVGAAPQRADAYLTSDELRAVMERSLLWTRHPLPAAEALRRGAPSLDFEADVCVEHRQAAVEARSLQADPD